MKNLFFNLFIFILIVINNQSSKAHLTQQCISKYAEFPFGNQGRGILDNGNRKILVCGDSHIGFFLIFYDDGCTEIFNFPYNGFLFGDATLTGDATSSSGIGVIGGAISGGPTQDDFFTSKFDTETGDTIWIRFYDAFGLNDKVTKVNGDSQGNVYVTGYSTGMGTHEDFLTIKYDGSGNEVWARRYSYFTNNRDFPTDIAIDPAGNVYVTGQIEYTGGTYYYMTLKYNNAGVLQWDRLYFPPSGGAAFAKSMQVDSSGSVYVTGFGHEVNGSDDFITIKYDTYGNVMWIKKYNGPGNNIDHAVETRLVYSEGNTSHPDLIVAGTSQLDFLTLKYNGDNGNVIWEKRYDGPSNSIDDLKAIDIDEYGNVVVTGSSFDYSSRDDYMTIKYNGINGNEIWSQRANATSNGNEIPAGVAVGRGGKVYVTGTASSYYIETIKYSEYFDLKMRALAEGFYNNTSNIMIEDTASVYLRKTSSPYSIVDSSVSVLDSNGRGTFTFPPVSTTIPYYVVVKHRNSIETWSSAGQSFTSDSMSYDFTTAANKAYGNNLVQKGSKFCIYSGDVNQDGIIDLLDNSLIDNDAYDFATGYLATDLTGDEFVDLVDLAIADNNAFNFISVIRP